MPRHQTQILNPKAIRGESEASITRVQQSATPSATVKKVRTRTATRAQPARPPNPPSPTANGPPAAPHQASHRQCRCPRPTTPAYPHSAPEPPSRDGWARAACSAARTPARCGAAPPASAAPSRPRARVGGRHGATRGRPSWPLGAQQGRTSGAGLGHGERGEGRSGSGSGGEGGR